MQKPLNDELASDARFSFHPKVVFMATLLCDNAIDRESVLKPRTADSFNRNKKIITCRSFIGQMYNGVNPFDNQYMRGN